MAAGIVRLRTRADRLREDQAATLRQAVLELPGLPDRAVGEIVAAIDRETASASGWTFAMMSPADNLRVVNWLVANSARPLVAVRLWALLFDHLRRDTGEIMLTRDELAAAVGDTPRHVSELMGELAGIGAVSRRRERVPGLRGPGVVRFFMSPRIGTHLTGAARDKAQAAAPELRLVPVPTSGGDLWPDPPVDTPRAARRKLSDGPLWGGELGV